MINFLRSVVKKFYGQKIETPLENGRKMLSVITIMCCISRMVSICYKLNQLLDLNSIRLFLAMLRLRPEQEHERCIDWEYLDKNIPDDFKKKSYDSVQMFIDESSSAEPLLNPMWLYAIPVMHFLKGVSKPFQEFELNPKGVPFEDKSLGGLGAIKIKTYHRDDFT